MNFSSIMANVRLEVPACAAVAVATQVETAVGATEVAKLTLLQRTFQSQSGCGASPPLV
jgi:hypothetical protein